MLDLIPFPESHDVFPKPLQKGTQNFKKSLKNIFTLLVLQCICHLVGTRTWIMQNKHTRIPSLTP